MRPTILNQVMIMIGLGVLSFAVRLVLLQYFFAQPLGDFNKKIAKQMESAARQMNYDAPQNYSTRDQYKTDAQWEEATFKHPSYPPPSAHVFDDPDADAQKPKIPAPPPSSWVVFASSGTAGDRILHARLSLSAADGTPFLAIEFSQPQPANGDEGGTAQISFATVTQASCRDADALVLGFDNTPAVRYATKGLWGDSKCSFGVPDFAHFRDAVINASMLSVRLAKGKTLTQEIPAPVGGLSWNP